jgi:hypothetical protein
MLDEMFRVLADEHRRRVLVALLDHNPQDDGLVQVPEDLELDAAEQAQLQSDMFHVHLPKLEQAEFIRWDREKHHVEKGPRFDAIRPLLELMRNHADELPGDWP